MEIQKSSTLIKWAYLWETYIPSQTSLCVVFWRTVLFTPLKRILPTLCLVLLGVSFYRNPREFLIALALVVGILLFVGVVMASSERNYTSKVSNSVLFQGVRAIKKRFCPIIRIVEKVDPLDL